MLEYIVKLLDILFMRKQLDIISSVNDIENSYYFV